MPAGWELVATLGIVLVAGVITGLAGFGFALFAVPPLLFFHEAPAVVALVNMLGFSSGIVVLLGAWHEIRRPILLALAPWGLIGLFVGVVILRYVDDIAIKLLASSVVVLFAITAAVGFRLPGAERRAATAIAGFLSGVLGTSAGLAGPPVALLFTARDLPPAAFRVTITGYFMIVNSTAVALLAVSGQVRLATLWLALAMAPATFIGRWTGRKISGGMTPTTFRFLVIALLLLTGLTGMIGAVLSLN